MASDTSNFINIPIAPGGMLGDIVEDELGSHQHQRVENLRQVKKGEWELPPGYRNTLTGLINAKAGIEVDEDESGDRFRLIQDGINILRIDYDISNSPLFGYENESTVTLGLPSGVTIASTVTLRFFHFRGVIRISGASGPLHYSFIDRTLFDGDDSFDILGWKLEKSPLLWAPGTNDLQLVDADNVPTRLVVPAEDLTNVIYLKFFYVFDNGQFELLKEIDNLISGSAFNFTNLQHEYVLSGRSSVVQLHLRINGSGLKNAMFNNRITGVGLAVVNKQYATSGVTENVSEAYVEGEEDFSVPFVLNFDNLKGEDDLGEVAFTLRNAHWESGNNTELEITDTTNDYYLNIGAGSLGVGVEVEITFNGVSTTGLTVVSIDFGDMVTPGLLTVSGSMAAVFGSTGDKTNVGIKITRKWQYDSVNGYHTYIGLDALVLGPLYEDFAGIPIGTLQNTPNWDAIQFLGERSYISGQTGDISSSVVSGGTIETVTIVEDNFTDTNGVLLTAHTMDLGDGWVSPDGDPTRWEIQSNQAQNSASGTNNRVVVESNRSDQITISGSMEIDSSLDSVNIIFRHTNSPNEWRFQYLASASGAEFRIERIIGGVVTTRDSSVHTVADGATVTWEIILDGDNIKCNILTPEVHSLETDDVFNITATEHGMVSGTAGSVIDSFKITEDILTPTSNAVANDNFTDTNGVALTAHTMNLGNGWTSAGAQWEIQSNQARDSGAGSGVQVITELNKSNKLIITGKIMINDPLDETRISFRHFTIANEWYFAYSGSNDPKFEIRRVIATVHTTQATQAHTVSDGVFVSFQITLDGSSIELKIISPEVYTLTVTDSTHLTETKLAFFPLATNAGVTRIDDLVIVETVESFIIESNEEDTVRNSPLGQFDNHPIGNAIQTEVGTTDKILNLAKRDNQLTILKARSISTGGFVGAFYSENIGFTKHGLFSVLGVLSVTITINAEESNEFILIMDQDDLYLYNGNQIVSFFEKVELRQFYRDNVTTSSFMQFDKLNGEILFFLGTEILVWNMHIPEFYIRKTDITPLYGFLDADNALILGNATKQVTFNHGLGTPYDESMSLLIRTKINDLKTPHRFKRLAKLHSYLSSSGDTDIALSDVQGAVPGVQMQNTRGVVDHWIAECVYITASGCYDTDLDSWLNTQSGRTEFETISSGAFTIQMLQAELNNRDVATIPNSPTNHGRIENSGTLHIQVLMTLSLKYGE